MPPQILRRIISRFADWWQAIDKALVATPVDLGLHVARLQALEGLGDGPGIGKQLENMARLFPENPQVAQGRVQWFLNNGNNTAAVGAQRDLAALFPDEPSYALQVVSLLNQFEGIDSARRELVNLASGQDHIAVFTRALADFELQQGNPWPLWMRIVLKKQLRICAQH